MFEVSKPCWTVCQTEMLFSFAFNKTGYRGQAAIPAQGKAVRQRGLSRLRAQQQVIAESFERAKKEEEAALALRG